MAVWWVRRQELTIAWPRQAGTYIYSQCRVRVGTTQLLKVTSSPCIVRADRKQWNRARNNKVCGNLFTSSPVNVLCACSFAYHSPGRPLLPSSLVLSSGVAYYVSNSKVSSFRLFLLLLLCSSIWEHFPRQRVWLVAGTRTRTKENGVLLLFVVRKYSTEVNWFKCFPFLHYKVEECRRAATAFIAIPGRRNLLSGEKQLNCR